MCAWCSHIMCLMCAHNVTWGCTQAQSTSSGLSNAVSHVFIRQIAFNREQIAWNSQWCSRKSRFSATCSQNGHFWWYFRLFQKLPAVTQGARSVRFGRYYHRWIEFCLYFSFLIVMSASAVCAHIRQIDQSCIKFQQVSSKFAIFGVLDVCL